MGFVIRLCHSPSFNELSLRALAQPTNGSAPHRHSESNQSVGKWLAYVSYKQLPNATEPNSGLRLVMESVLLRHSCELVSGYNTYLI